MRTIKINEDTFKLLKEVEVLIKSNAILRSGFNYDTIINVLLKEEKKRLTEKIKECKGVKEC